MLAINNISSPTDETWLYPIGYYDFHVKAIVGWAMSSCMDKNLVSQSQAVTTKRPAVGTLCIILIED